MKKSLLLVLIASFSLLLWNCGGDDPVTPKDTTTTNKDSVTEFFIIDGNRYEAKDMKKKIIRKLNRITTMDIYLSNGVLPAVYLEHERVGDTLLPRIYEITNSPRTNFEFEEFEVPIAYSEGALLVYCQFVSQYKPPTPHGKYELKRVGTKLVSEFGKALMTCVSGGDGKATSTIEGVVVWEEK